MTALSPIDALPGRMRTIAGFLAPLAPRRTVAEISAEMAALRTKADAHPGRSHLASEEDQDAYCRLADHGLDLEHEWLASFERETGVDFNMIRSFL